VVRGTQTSRHTRLGFRGVGTVLIGDFASSSYFSQYNPIECVWGVLEQHWNGSLLDARDTVLRLAKSMTWNGFSPVVTFVAKTYQTGVHLSHQAMAALEKRLTRWPTLPKWFVEITPLSG